MALPGVAAVDRGGDGARLDAQRGPGLGGERRERSSSPSRSAPDGQLRTSSRCRGEISSPTADSTPAAAGTITVVMPIASANAHACSGPAPPNATSASPAGSTPRTTETWRSACSIPAFTTATTPSASTPACAERALRRGDVERGAGSTERRVGRDAPEREVGVGDRRLLAAAPVARGAGIGAGRRRAHHQRAARVDAGDAAAARADGVDVDRRQPHREARDRVLRGDRGRAVGNQAHVGARAAHVEAHRVGEPAGTRRLGRGPRAGGRTREQERRGQLRPAFHVEQAARRRHDHHLIGRVGETLEVRATHRAQRRVDDGRDRALVLTHLGGDLVRRAHVETLRAQLGRERRFVGIVEVRVEQADGDGFCAFGDCGGGAGAIGEEHGAVGGKALVHLQPPRPGDERRGAIHERVVEAGAVLATDLDDVGEPGGGVEGHRCESALQQCVGRDGRAVGQHLDAGRRELPRRRCARPGQGRSASR